MSVKSLPIVGFILALFVLLGVTADAARSSGRWVKADLAMVRLAELEEASIQHMLRTRTGMDAGYDRLAEDVIAERGALREIVSIAPSSDVALRSALDRAEEHRIERETAIQVFATENAAVQEARRAVPEALERSLESSDPRVVAAAHALERALIRHEFAATEAARVSCLVAIDELAVNAASSPDGDHAASLARQARLLVVRGARSDAGLDVVAQRQATGPYRALAELVYARTDAAHWRTYRLGQWLALVSLALVAGLIGTMARLSRSQDLVGRMNTELEARVELRTTQLAAANRQLIAVSRAKSDFLANMSHEIRTPLTAVQGYAELMLDPDLDQSERLNHVLTIRRNGAHLLGVLNDILDLSKIEADRMTFESLPFSPAKLLVDVVSLMRVRAVEKGIALHIRFVTPIPESMDGDPTRVRQIALNLVGNAIKFTERGAVTLDVAYRQEAPARLSVSVRDTGIGLSEIERGRLFQPFTQADTSTTRRFGGSGLGLSICHRLVTAMGGDLTVESRPGAGSCFRFEIPAVTPAGVRLLHDLSEAITPPVITQERPQPQARIEIRGRVLLAEDGRDNQLLISTHLRKAGAHVTIAENGAIALRVATKAAAAGAPFDVILMDMQMPELDGYGATSKLRARGNRAPIIALTAHAMAGDRERCVAAGCDDYLAKPVDRDVLLRTVLRWITGEGAPVATVERPPARPAPLHSTLAGDPDMVEIVDAFVSSLPERIAELQRALASNDRDDLRRLAHQLKGAGGGYGFGAITERASDLEAAVVTGAEPRRLVELLTSLSETCKRACSPFLGAAAAK